MRFPLDPNAPRQSLDAALRAIVAGADVPAGAHIQGEWATLMVGSMMVAQGHRCSCGVIGCNWQTRIPGARPTINVRNPSKYFCATCRLVLERADVESHTDRYHAVLSPSGRLEELDAERIAAEAASERWWR